MVGSGWLVVGWSDEANIEGANIVRDASAGRFVFGGGRIVQRGGDWAEEGVEVFGQEFADVGGPGEMAGGFGLGSPTAEEFEDGEEELILGEGEVGRPAPSAGGEVGRPSPSGGPNGVGFTVAGFEFIERFDGAEEEAEGRQVDLGSEDRRFFVPNRGGAVVAGFRGFLRRELMLRGVVRLFDDAEEADAFGGMRQILLSEMLADFRITG